MANLNLLAPIASEHEWLEALVGIPAWRPPAKRTVVIAPHPDDETLGAGALIAAQCRRRLDVFVIAVTDGEAAYPNSPGLGELRRLEQEQALITLGVSPTAIIRLGLPDSKVASQEDRLASLIAPHLTKDSLLVAPWPLDWHPDHEAGGRAAERAVRASGAELVFYLFWTWHHKGPQALAGLSLRRFEVESSLLALKEFALQSHRSQLEWEYGPAILPEKFLAPARRPFETFIAHA